MCKRHAHSMIGGESNVIPLSLKIGFSQSMIHLPFPSRTTHSLTKAEPLDFGLAKFILLLEDFQEMWRATAFLDLTCQPQHLGVVTFDHRCCFRNCSSCCFRNCSSWFLEWWLCCIVCTGSLPEQSNNTQKPRLHIQP